MCPTKHHNQNKIAKTIQMLFNSSDSKYRGLNPCGKIKNRTMLPISIHDNKNFLIKSSNAVNLNASKGKL